MITAASTFLEVLFAGLILSWVLLLWTAAVVDVIRADRGGWAVVATLVLIMIVPILGPILYFAFARHAEAPGGAEGAAMAEADMRRERARRPVGGTGSY
jgi:Zn-dependent protease with chaperone function